MYLLAFGSSLIAQVATFANSLVVRPAFLVCMSVKNNKTYSLYNFQLL